jgi:D-alanine-D-alanine ligase
MDKVLSLFCASSDRLRVDIFLPAFHGEFGEDGCIQGLLEMADVAYTSSGVLSSSVAMNKYVCKSVLQTHGIPSLPAALVNKFEATEDLAKARAQILSTPGLESYPLFVKPNHLGSSIGIGRAENETGLNAALARVFLHDLQAIVEPCLTEMFEINVSVMDGEPARASVVEIPVSQSGLLSYEEKYMRDKGRKKTGESSEGMASLTRSIDPVNLPVSVKDQVSEYALKAFRLLDCRGVVRFDFMFDKRAEQIYFNELNPLPGSFSFYLWVKSHPPLLYTEELSLLIEHALKRKQQSAAVQRNLGFRAL